jgi:hypothetical protein
MTACSLWTLQAVERRTQNTRSEGDWYAHDVADADLRGRLPADGTRSTADPPHDRPSERQVDVEEAGVSRNGPRTPIHRTGVSFVQGCSML